MLTSTQSTIPDPGRAGWLDTMFRKRVTAQLEKLNHGQLILDDGIQQWKFGKTLEFTATIKVHSPAFFRNATGGSVSIGGSYISGEWDCDDLTSLFRIFILNQQVLGQLNALQSTIAGFGRRLGHWLKRNSMEGSRRNIAAHYDLGNDFYRLWLDETMAYSSGVFRHLDSALPADRPAENRNQLLLDASREKFDRVCRKLELSSSTRVLEIGTGWGGFSIHAAQQAGCHVTSTTISAEQYQESKQRISHRNLENQIELKQLDYRQLRGHYDRLVSIEMIEAVGYRYLDTFFQKCSEVLRPDGSMLLQAIVMPEKRYESYLKSVDFIQKYVFPGGCLPSVSAMLESVGRVTDLRMVHLEDLAPHYARTLRIWRENFFENIDLIRDLGYPEELIRTWNFYLCYCEAAFAECHIGVVQLVLDKPHCQRDPVRITDNAAVYFIDRNLSEPPTTVRSRTLTTIGGGS